jgi:hypothetical protein
MQDSTLDGCIPKLKAPWLQTKKKKKKNIYFKNTLLLGITLLNLE